MTLLQAQKTRDVAEAALWSLLAGVALALAWWAVQTLRTERMGTGRIGTEPIRTERIAAQPMATDRNATEPNGSERWNEVYAAIGPPPTPDAVPVAGYVTRAGVNYPPRWRTRPDAEKGNNFKK